jgi:long-chain fatty acid transport protein
VEFVSPWPAANDIFLEPLAHCSFICYISGAEKVFTARSYAVPAEGRARGSMIRSLVLSALCLTLAASSFALGSAGEGDEDVGARTLSMGGVGIAQSYDATAAFLNPAALPYIPGYDVSLGAALIVPDITFMSASGARSGMESVPLLVPNLAASAPIVKDKLSAGLAVESPFGGDFQWSDTSPMRYLATKAILNLIDISPSVGYKLTDKISVGGSLHYYDTSDLTRVNAVNEAALNHELGGAASGADAAADLNGTGQKLGYGASIYWRPTDEHAFGLTYRSQATIDVTGTVGLSGLNGNSAGLFGGSSFSTSAQGNIVIPATVQLGWSYKPNSRWNVEADAAWYGWSAFHSLTLYFPNATANQQAVLGANAENGNYGEPKNWWNVTSVAIGAEYQALDNLKLRGGYAYMPGPGPTSTWQPEELDLTRHEFAVGAGVHTQPVDVDLTYLMIIFPATSVNNNVGATSGTPIDGTFSGVAHLVALNFSRRF